MNKSSIPRTYVLVVFVLCSLSVLNTSFNHHRNNNETLIREVEVSKTIYSKDYVKWFEKYEYIEKEYQNLKHAYSKVLNENEVLTKRIKKVKNYYENTREIPIYDYTEEEVYLLAQCVQAEAGSYEVADKAQKMITQVILNRVASGYFPTTITEVIYQRRNGIPQFSVAYNGMLEKQEVTPETMMNVLEVLMYGYDMPENVLYFYADFVKGNWVNTLRVYKTVQGTVFAYSND